MLKKWHPASFKRPQILQLRSFLFILFCQTISFTLQAQNTTEKVQMADGLRSNGKIFVVVAVLLTVLAGLFLYLIRLDKKIARLEKENKE